MRNLSRRDYLKTAAVAAGGAFLLPRFAIGKPGMRANSKLNIALIGSGGMAHAAFSYCRGENVIAIAEVDDARGAVGYEAFPKAKRYKDFRRMFDAHARELDLVIVSTPDHTHFPASLMAIERGIAVHTQKPLTHNIWQARTLKAATEKYKVKTVMGNQGHNWEGMRLIREWYEAGMVGNVDEVHAWTNRTTTNTGRIGSILPEQAVPPTLDWDLWLGPVEKRPYNAGYCPDYWRWWWEFGGGGLGDIGCHTLEVPYYGMQLGYPSSVSMVPDMDFRKEFDGATPHEFSATYLYEFDRPGRSPLKVYWYEGGRLPKFPDSLPNDKVDLEGGVVMFGDENILYSPGMRPGSPRLLNNWDEIRRNLPAKTLPRAVGDPVQEIIAAVREEIPGCSSNFDYASKLTEVVILGTIANRAQKKVEFNPQSMTFKDASLNKYIKEPVRKGWEFGEGLI